MDTPRRKHWLTSIKRFVRSELTWLVRLVDASSPDWSLANQIVEPNMPTNPRTADTKKKRTHKKSGHTGERHAWTAVVQRQRFTYMNDNKKQTPSSHKAYTWIEM